MRRRQIIIAGEEGGPSSNKLGGIWEVIDAEATALAKQVAPEAARYMDIFVAGPFFRSKDDDWGMKRRMTKLDYAVMPPLRIADAEVVRLRRSVEGKEIIYLLFDTSGYSRGTPPKANAIKTEAYELLGLDSLSYEKAHYGREYTHYLDLSYAISEFARQLATKGEVSLHCHEYSVFYAGARLKKLGAKVKCIATYHGTKVGRAYGARVLEKLASKDGAWPRYTENGLAELEGLSRYFDKVTFVGDSTRAEGRLFYGVDGVIIRNGINIEREAIDWDKKEASMRKLQEFLAERISKVYGLELNPKKLLPLYTISRTEIENKGYLDLLDSLVIFDRVLQHHIKDGEVEEDTRVVCLLITAQAPKEKLPDTFPVSLEGVPLGSEEQKLNAIIHLHELGIDKMAENRRVASALLYPQWVGKDDEALGMSIDEIAAGCIAGIFPSRYDPFLLTALEAAKEGTPVVVSRVCGFSDAVYDYIRRKGFAGGVEIVDNVSLPYIEAVADYSTALYTITEAYLKDRSKYKMMCSEAYRLAEGMSWDEPAKEYLKLLGNAG